MSATGVRPSESATAASPVDVEVAANATQRHRNLVTGRTGATADRRHGSLATGRPVGIIEMAGQNHRPEARRLLENRPAPSVPEA